MCLVFIFLVAHAKRYNFRSHYLYREALKVSGDISMYYFYLVERFSTELLILFFSKASRYNFGQYDEVINFTGELETSELVKHTNESYFTVENVHIYNQSLIYAGMNTKTTII